MNNVNKMNIITNLKNLFLGVTTTTTWQPKMCSYKRRDLKSFMIDMISP